MGKENEEKLGSIHYQDWKSPFGEMRLAVFQDQLVACDWKYRKQAAYLDEKLSQHLSAHWQPSEHHPIFDETKEQLTEYFHRRRESFSLPLLLCGTRFQKSVWEELLKIPFGSTSSYGELAKTMNQPKAVRAIATANGANRLAIIVPCHRVIGADGSLTGYAGGLRVKRRLLELENPQPSLFE